MIRENVFHVVTCDYGELVLFTEARRNFFYGVKITFGGSGAFTNLRNSGESFFWHRGNGVNAIFPFFFPSSLPY